MKQFVMIFFIGSTAACQAPVVKDEALPTFDILLADSATRFNFDTVKEGSPVVLLYFSPDCEHCQEETQSILDHMDALKKVQFYFVTNDPFDRLKMFNDHYQLGKYPNITLGRDDGFFIIRHFKGASPPYLVLYDGHKRQKTVFEGGVTADKLIVSINNL